METTTPENTTHHDESFEQSLGLRSKFDYVGPAVCALGVLLLLVRLAVGRQELFAGWASFAAASQFIAGGMLIVLLVEGKNLRAARLQLVDFRQGVSDCAPQRLMDRALASFPKTRSVERMIEQVHEVARGFRTRRDWFVGALFMGLLVLPLLSFADGFEPLQMDAGGPPSYFELFDCLLLATVEALLLGAGVGFAYVQWNNSLQQWEDIVVKRLRDRADRESPPSPGSNGDGNQQAKIPGGTANGDSTGNQSPPPSGGDDKREPVLTPEVVDEEEAATTHDYGGFG